MRFLTPYAARKAPPARREPAAPRRASPPIGRPSWYQVSGVASPLYRIPEAANLRLYGELRKLIPLLDVAIQKLIQFMGTPTCECDDLVKEDLTEWMRTVQVNREQYGFDNWLKIWMGDLLTYGRAHTEMVFTPAGDEIQGLVELVAPTIHARPKADGYGLEWVQDAVFASQPILLPEQRMLHGFHDIRGDGPYGTSLLHSLEFTGEVWINMVRALGQTWDRMGAPSFQVHHKLTEALDDPESTTVLRIVNQSKGDWEAAMNSRKDGKVRDYFTYSSADGDVLVRVIGADGQVMEFEMPGRAMMEQIQAKTGLAPFMFGLQWATTERLSEQQAKLLTQMINWLRGEAQEPIERCINLRQQLVGRPSQIKLQWPELSLVDQETTARADFMDAQADSIEWDNLMKQWREGIVDQYFIVRAVREEFADLTDAEIKARLPKLSTEPPEETPAGPGMLPPDMLGPGAGNGRQPAGANGNGRR